VVTLCKEGKMTKTMATKKSKKEGGVKRMKKIALLTLLIAAVSLPAFAFDLGGYTGPLTLKFFDWTVGREYSPKYDASGQNLIGWDPEDPYNNWNGSGDANGLPNPVDQNDPAYNLPVAPNAQFFVDQNQVEDSWGIITMTQIFGTTSNPLWNAGNNGEYINGIVYGFDDAYITPSTTFLGFSGIGVGQVGGVIELYINNFTLDHTQDPDTRNAYVAAITSGQPFLKLIGVPGIGPLPLLTRWEAVNQLTAPFTGVGAGYFDVDTTFGLGAAFDNNSYGPGGADMYTVFNFGDNFPPLDRQLFDAMSSDPAQTTIIPEPTTMLLLGSGILGLLGMVGIRRRKA